jgi:hypothetical protein
MFAKKVVLTKCIRWFEESKWISIIQSLLDDLGPAARRPPANHD